MKKWGLRLLASWLAKTGVTAVLFHGPVSKGVLALIARLSAAQRPISEAGRLLLSNTLFWGGLLLLPIALLLWDLSQAPLAQQLGPLFGDEPLPADLEAPGDVAEEGTAPPTRKGTFHTLATTSVLGGVTLVAATLWSSQGWLGREHGVLETLQVALWILAAVWLWRAGALRPRFARAVHRAVALLALYAALEEVGLHRWLAQRPAAATLAQAVDPPALVLAALPPFDRLFYPALAVLLFVLTFGALFARRWWARRLHGAWWLPSPNLLGLAFAMLIARTVSLVTGAPAWVETQELLTVSLLAFFCAAHFERVRRARLQAAG